MLVAATLTVVGLLAVILLSLARTRALRRARDVTVFAHRGFAGEAPENTIDAVGRAAARADAVEVDVRRCGSGELVCVHDETLERFTGVPTRVEETNWETLREVEVGPDATVPRLEDVLSTLDAHEDVLLNVELKERGLADDLLTHLERYDGEVLVSSFDRDALAAVRARDDSLPLAYVFRSPRGAFAVAEDLECVAVHPRADLCARTLVVPRAHRRGLTVNAWTADSRLETVLLAFLGVDGVFVDRYAPLESLVDPDR